MQVYCTLWKAASFALWRNYLSLVKSNLCHYNRVRTTLSNQNSRTIFLIFQGLKFAVVDSVVLVEYTFAHYNKTT